jgi:hypothetical protein
MRRCVSLKPALSALLNHLPAHADALGTNAMEDSMKASCPRCGRGTEIDSEAGDFPMRCQRCGALVRRGGKREEEGTDELPVRRIERGTLAGLLISRTADELAPAVIRAGSMAGGAGSLLRPESRKAIARAAARQKALRQAELRASLQSFKALSWAGLGLVALLLMGAGALKARAMWRHPTPTHADTLLIGR